MLSASILLSLKNNSFAKNEISWSESIEESDQADDGSISRRNDIAQGDFGLSVQGRNAPESEDGDAMRRSDDLASPSDVNVINVTPSSFSDIFVKPKLAQLAVESGMVLVKKKTTDSPSPSPSPTPTTPMPPPTTTFVSLSSTSPSTTTVFHISTTTTPFVVVKKKTSPEEEGPVLVVGPNSEISFKNVGSPEHDEEKNIDPILNTWNQGRV